MKFYSDYDVFMIYDINNLLVGVYTQDLMFAKTVKQLLQNVEKHKNLFTPSIRCVIIKYKDFSNHISLRNLVSRYSTKTEDGAIWVKI